MAIYQASTNDAPERFPVGLERWAKVVEKVPLCPHLVELIISLQLGGLSGSIFHVNHALSKRLQAAIACDFARRDSPVRKNYGSKSGTVDLCSRVKSNRSCQCESHFNVSCGTSRA